MSRLRCVVRSRPDINLVTVSGDGDLKLPRETKRDSGNHDKGGDVKGKIIGPDGKTEKDITGPEW
jgi:hypothetical protein